MSKNKEYGEYMDAGVKGLVEHSKFDKSTGHVTYSAADVALPDGVTQESLEQHIEVINNLSAQVEVATQQIAHREYELNNKLTTVDGGLKMGSMAINSQYHLKQQVGDEFLYGQATTAVDYMHTAEQAEYLQTNRASSQDLAAKLFG